MDAFLSFYKRKTEWKLYLNRLINSIHDIPDITQYMQEYTQEQIKLGNIENMILMINFLELNENNLNLFTEIGDLATASGKYKEIKKIMYNKTFNISYSCKAGEIPESFKETIKNLENISKNAKPGKFRNLINSLIEEKNQNINAHKDQIEEDKYRLN